MPPTEPIILVCIPANAARFIAQGSICTHQCSQCHQTVVMAPSGQRFLKEHPEASILCALCYQPDPDDEQRLVASRAELSAKFQGARPNTWRNRN
jgi:hypothetical protein